MKMRWAIAAASAAVAISGCHPAHLQDPRDTFTHHCHHGERWSYLKERCAQLKPFRFPTPKVTI